VNARKRAESFDWNDIVKKYETFLQNYADE